jgi:hypothetical protein
MDVPSARSVAHSVCGSLEPAWLTPHQRMEVAIAAVRNGCAGALAV